MNFAREPRLAKLTRPRVDGLLPRERLFAVLDEAQSRCPVIWLCAPPGAGKTSLIASYVALRKRPGLWYQLDSADSDPGAFFVYLRAGALELPGAKRRALPVLTAENPPDLPGFARLYFRALFARMGEGAILVLDNYQELAEASELHAALAAGLEEVPPDTHVVITSRMGPPAAHAALRATRRLTELQWPQLRLTLDETARIAAREQALPEDTLRALHEHTHGWAAGLILMLERLKQTGQLKSATGGENLEMVFDYFAGLLFNAASGPVRDALMRMAYLPQLTAELASAISGNPEAPKLLAEFSRRNLFIDRHYGEETSYQFHALFRAFLQNQARHTLEAAEHGKLMHSAAALLETAGQVDDAFPLYLETRAWEAATRLVRKEAARLVREGRRRTLRDWISALPLQAVEADAWLSYWLAVTLLPEDRRQARARMESAYACFSAERDVAGMMTCAALAADSYFSDGWVGVQPWIDRLRACMQAPHEEVSATVVANSLQSLTRAMCFHALGDAALAGFVASVSAHLDAQGQAAQDVRAVGVLMLYHWLQGNAAGCEAAYRRLPAQWIELDVPVADRLFCAYFSLCHLFASGARNDAQRLLAGVGQLTDEFNLAPLGVEFQYVSALPLIQDGDLAGARDLLDKRVRPYLATARPMAAAWYHAMSAVCELGLGKPEQALRAMEIAIHQCMERENAASRSMMEPGYAFVLMETGHAEKGLQVLRDLCHRLPGNPRVHFTMLVGEAWVALKAGDTPRLESALRAAIQSLANSGGHWLAWTHIVLPKLLAQALERSIEPAAVRTYIEKFHMRCPDAMLEAWPWPVRIHALGALRVSIQGAPKSSRSKAQHRLLDLLRLLIVVRSASTESLVDVLWPDAEGDRGRNALQVSVHRLRKLLGRDDALVLHDAKLSLSPRVCWVDAWAFEQMATQALTMTAEDARLRHSCEAALRLYKDHLLNQEAESGWLIAHREKLRRLWHTVLMKLAQHLDACGEHDAVQTLCRQALDMDPMAEEIHRCLKRSRAGLSHGGAG